MPTYHVFFAPEGRQIAVIANQTDARRAKRVAANLYPKYKCALGELYALEVLRREVHRIYEIKLLSDNSVRVYSLVNGALVEMWSHGAWLDNGRMPDDTRMVAESLIPVSEPVAEAK